MGLCASKEPNQEQKREPKEENKKAVEIATSPSKERKDDAGDAETEDYLSHVPLLAKLKPEEKKVLAANLTKKYYHTGQKIIYEGADGDEFFLIKDGQCLVTKEEPETGKILELCELKKGDYFGEAALRTNSKRAATITAKTDTLCLTLNRQKFSELFGEKVLKIQFAKRVGVSAEVYNNKEMKQPSAPNNANRAKTEEEKTKILEVLRKNMLFKNLDIAQCKNVVNEMWFLEVEAGTAVIRQGDLGDYFYVVHEGEFDIFLNQPNGAKPKQVATYGEGTSFGELALMYHAPRAATVTANRPSKLWAVDRITYRRILTAASRAKHSEYESFLVKIDAFSALNAAERSQIAEALEECLYPAGRDIVREGDEGDTFFILRKGEVVVKKLIEGVQQEVMRYKPGEYFGERALIRSEPRAATCTALVDSECLCLNRNAFTHLLGPLEDIFAERDERYSVMNQSGGSPRIEKKQERKMPTKSWKLSDFTVVGTLGRGSFGHVQLVKDQSGKTYALKSVNKAQVVRLQQIEHIMNEKRVMAMLEHPFLVTFYGSFKDKNNLYFLLEPVLGGELFSVLRAKTFFDEATAKFFAGCVVLAFEYMHSENIIYRDLKPENLLLDADGYLKITDFGFAKFIKDSQTWTLCGTPDYLAPEVVSGQGHSFGVDWWTLGILIYEMLASYPPFYDEDPMKTYAKIMHGQLVFPMHFTKNSVDLIRRLLHHRATKRLGVLKGGAKLIIEHSWFKGFDWDGLLRKRLTAPIIQNVRGTEDLSNFDNFSDEAPPLEEYTVDPRNPNWDDEF